jgi:hypothetical protein
MAVFQPSVSGAKPIDFSISHEVIQISHANFLPATSFHIQDCEFNFVINEDDFSDSESRNTQTELQKSDFSKFYVLEAPSKTLTAKWSVFSFSKHSLFVLYRVFRI